jgi:hypothetical protein
VNNLENARQRLAHLPLNDEAALHLDQAAECIKASGSKGATLPALKKFVAAARGAGYVNGTFSSSSSARIRSKHCVH